MTHDAYKNRILVVDDNQSTLYLYKKILEQHYTLLSASSGQEALQILKEQDPPELILLDIMMPEMCGFTLFQEIKKEVRIASIPVIFVTALHSDADELKGLEAGAVDYITKPIEQSVLMVRIKNILELCHYQRESEEKLPEIPNELLSDELTGLSLEEEDDTQSDQHPLIVVVNPEYDSHRHDLIQQELSAEYEIIQFNNKAEALRYCRQERLPDLILLDMDRSADVRFEVINEFKLENQTRSIPIILLTSKRSAKDETSAFQSGCADYITKPIVPAVLKARIRIHIELKRYCQCFEQQLEAFLDE